MPFDGENYQVDYDFHTKDGLDVERRLFYSELRRDFPDLAKSKLSDSVIVTNDEKIAREIFGLTIRHKATTANLSKIEMLDRHPKS